MGTGSFGGKSRRLLAGAIALGLSLGWGGAVSPACAAVPTMPVVSDLTHTIGGSSFLLDQNGTPIDVRTGSHELTAATVVMLGSLNGVQLQDGQLFDGVATSIVGQANYTKNANAALIYGAGNKVTNSYREAALDPSVLGQVQTLARQGKYDEISALLQEAVPESGGQVMVVGGGNTVDKAYLTQVMGVGNTVTGATDTLDAAKATQLNYVDGFYNTVTNGQHIYVLGGQNTVQGGKIAENHHNTAIGDENKVTGSVNTKILGDRNEVLNGWYERGGFRKVVTGINQDVRIVGSGNKVQGSHRQLVLGDNNEIIARDGGTVSDYQHPDGREPYTMDLTIGRNNVLHNNDTYRKQWESVKVIGNNNRADGGYGSDHAGGPNNMIVIGDNQKFTISGDSIVVGSISPEEQKEQKYQDDRYKVSGSSVIMGHHSYASGGGDIVIGMRSYAEGGFNTIVGHGSRVDSIADESGGRGWFNGMYATVNGAFNRIKNEGSYSGSADEEAKLARGTSGIANTVQGTFNETTAAKSTQIVGSGNEVKHATGGVMMPRETAGEYLFGHLIESGHVLDETSDAPYGTSRQLFLHYLAYGGGGVSVLGNVNKTDYAVRSQILGMSNELTGTADQLSIHNTVAGFMNKGTNLRQTTLVGTGNVLEASEDNVVIGDYHELKKGKHNVILGSRESEEKTVAIDSATGSGPSYEIKVRKARKAHQEDLENAVFLGYDTEVTENGGVALGSLSVADRGAGEVEGYGHDLGTSPGSGFVWKPTLAAVSVGGPAADGSQNTRRIVNLAAGLEDTDAVNVAQLKQAMENSTGGSANLIAGEGIKLAKGADGSWTISTNFRNSGSDTVTYEDGGTTPAPIPPAPPAPPGAGVTDTGAAAVIETKLTADDGNTTALGGALGVKGDGRNIQTSVSGSDVQVRLQENIQVTSVTADTIAINDGPAMSREGLDMKDKKVTNVADGEISAASKDAVNGSQLYGVTNELRDVGQRVDQLGDRVDKVGAHAASLAALHPLDYDRDHKLDFAAGTGHYRGNNALAIGAFYRPDRRTMLSLGGSTGGGENMWNFGVSIKMGHMDETANVSKAQLLAENEELKRNDQLQDQKIQELRKVVEELQKKINP